MTVCIDDDFSPEKTADSGQCFRAAVLSDGAVRFMTGDSVVYLKRTGDGFEASCGEEEWESIWRPYFDLDTSYADIRRDIRDGYFRKAAEAGKGIRILRQEPWETLVSFIISQRKNIPSIKNAIETLADRFGHTVVTPRETLRAFPSPEELSKASSDDLAACGLGYRVSYVEDAVERTRSGSLDLKAIDALGDEELINALMNVRGIGIKVSSCVALFAYGRKGVAPVDTWIAGIIHREFGDKNPFPALGDAAGILQQYAYYYARGA